MHVPRDSQNPDGSTFAGAVYVALLGRDGKARAPGGGQRFGASDAGLLKSAAAAASCQYVGSAVVGVGDLDGNGVPDMAVSV